MATWDFREPGHAWWACPPPPGVYGFVGVQFLVAPLVRVRPGAHGARERWHGRLRRRARIIIIVVVNHEGLRCRHSRRIHGRSVAVGAAAVAAVAQSSRGSGVAAGSVAHCAFDPPPPRPRPSCVIVCSALALRLRAAGLLSVLAVRQGLQRLLSVLRQRLLRVVSPVVGRWGGGRARYLPPGSSPPVERIAHSYTQCMVREPPGSAVSPGGD
eukprot:gene14772-biopygen6610